MTNITLGSTYRIKGKSHYFKKKYGTSNPYIRIEDTDRQVFGGSWRDQIGNPACMIFAMRSGFEGVGTGKVYYGKIGNMGELVDISELEKG